MHLQPSEIRYSQDSISNTFDQRSLHSSYLIGETLDDICDGRCSVDDIPTISVVNLNGEWVTRDNRRLWVFRHLERLGFCNEVPVKIAHSIPEAKLTAFNGGEDIRVRRYPGGRWYKARKQTRPSSRRPSNKRVYDINEQITKTNSFFDISNNNCNNAYSQSSVTRQSTGISANLNSYRSTPSAVSNTYGSGISTTKISASSNAHNVRTNYTPAISNTSGSGISTGRYSSGSDTSYVRTNNTPAISNTSGSGISTGRYSSSSDTHNVRTNYTPAISNTSGSGLSTGRYSSSSDTYIARTNYTPAISNTSGSGLSTGRYSSNSDTHNVRTNYTPAISNTSGSGLSTGRYSSSSDTHNVRTNNTPAISNTSGSDVSTTRAGAYHAIPIYIDYDEERRDQKCCVIL